jgi:hypothetical protein
MSPKPIKVRMTVTVEVDTSEWASLYGINESEVREDVKGYIRNLVQQSPAQDEGAITSVTAN